MKYRKKPVVDIINATRWCGTQNNIIDAVELLGEIKLKVRFRCDRISIFIKTIDGEIEVNYGDWIIKDTNGIACVCSHDVFMETYEKVEE